MRTPISLLLITTLQTSTPFSFALSCFNDMILKPRMVMPDFTGRVIDDGRLELQWVLGSGSYGVVYLTLDTTSPKHDPIYYAVKCLQKAGLTEEQLAAQFREIELHKMVSAHPNVLTYHRLYEEKKYLFIVLDLCHGGDLFSAIKERRLYHRNDHLAKTAILQLIDALSSCHDAGVFHRDLKPENILCGPDGLDIRLADFGLATDRYSSREFGTGSLFYMSPECIGKRSGFTQTRYSTRHSDIWSLGVIMINIITGFTMWRSASKTDEAFNHFLRNPDIIRSTHPISKGAAGIIKRIFVVNPLARITLPDLREEIVKLDTLFMSEEDLFKGPLSLREAAVNYSAPRRSSSDILNPRIHSSDAIVYGILDEEDPEEQYLFSSPGPDAPYPYLAPLSPHIISASREEPPVDVVLATLFKKSAAIRSHSGGSSSSGSSSGNDSDGPITPDTPAMNPAIEVPELAEGENLDQSVVFDPSYVASTEKFMPKAWLPGRFKTAVQLMRARAHKA